MALRFLLVNGGLDNLYHKFLRDNGFEVEGDYERYLLAKGEVDENFISVSHSIQDKKTTLALGYIEKVNRQSKSNSSSRISMGCEYEYIDPLGDQIPNNKLDAVLTIPEEAIQMTQHRSKFIGSHRIKEIATAPSNTSSRVLREFLYMGMEGEIACHETFSGVRLGPLDTQVMDVLAVVVAGGFSWSGEDNIAEGMGIVENSPKVSFVDGEYYYFPFFKVRLPSEMEVVPGVNDNKKDSGVEFRSSSLRGDNPDIGFLGYARKLNYEYTACHAIQAVQKPEEERDRNDVELVSAWNQHLLDWQQLLDANEISNINSNLRYGRCGEEFPDAGMLRKMASLQIYNHFITELAKRSQTDLEFKSEVRQMVTRFNKRVKEILT